MRGFVLHNEHIRIVNNIILLFNNTIYYFNNKFWKSKTLNERVISPY